MSLETARNLPIADLLRALSERLGLERTRLTVSLGAARDLSIADLLRALSEKLGSEYTRLEGTALPLKSEVSAPRSTHLGEHGDGSNTSKLCRLRVSKPKRTMFGG